MKYSDNEEKQKSLELAEDSREIEWTAPSFVAKLFAGDFQWGLIHPFPAQSAEDRKVGDVFVEKLEALLREHLDPDEVDRTGVLPQSTIDALAELGCFGIKIPTEYGGLGMSQVNYNRAVALVGSYCASTAVLLSAHQSIGVPQPLLLFGTDAQKKKYLPRLAKGAISAFALTEPEAGSDPAMMMTTAEPTEDGKHYIINGTKMWITNGPAAELLIVMARSPSITVHGREKKQITALIVERDMPGYEVIYECSFMGLHGIRNGLLKFTDVKVPVENIISGPGRGLKIALTTLNTGRLTVPAAGSAANKLCLKYCRQWAAERVQWGAPIGKHQAVTDMLARMAADTFATEAVAWLCSGMADRKNHDIRLEAAMAKLFVTEIGWRIADDAVQIRGGRGYESAGSLEGRGEKAMPLERILRDMRINRIIEGTTEIMRLFIAREAMDTHVQLLMPLMDPRVKGAAKRAAIKEMLVFYASWYPRQWLPISKAAPCRFLSTTNYGHLSAIPGLSRKLARSLFHAMGRYQKELEQEQLLLAHLVDIGTDLFAMSAALTYTEHMVGEKPEETSPNDLCDLFCREARKRIKDHFRDMRKHHNAVINRVGDRLLEGDYTWLESGILDGLE